MDNPDYILPYEATPKLITLMQGFKQALHEQVLNFAQTQDLQHLKKVITVLHQDLEIFKDNFENWYQNAETAAEIQMLESLAKELGEAQNLVAQTTAMLNNNNN